MNHAAPSPGLTHWEGEPIRVWERLWSIPRLEARTALGSTNDRIRELARDGAAPFTTVVAEEQTAGRGRGGRPWSSPRGRGLWLSTLLRPGLDEPRLLIPLLAGLAVARAVEAVAGGVTEGAAAKTTAEVKWPNDVLLEGRKVCGILCEATEGAVVVGIGINVRQRLDDFPPEVRGRAIALDEAAGGRVSRSALAGTTLKELRALVSRPVLRLEGAVGAELARRDALVGRQVRIGAGGGGTTEGRALGIDPSGALLVEGSGEAPLRITAGSVRLAGEGKGT